MSKCDTIHESAFSIQHALAAQGAVCVCMGFCISCAVEICRIDRLQDVTQLTDGDFAESHASVE